MWWILCNEVHGVKVLTSEAAELEMIGPPWKQTGGKHVYRVEGGVCM